MARLSHPLIEKPVKSRGKGKKGKRKGKSSSQKGGIPTCLGTPGILPKNTEFTCRVSSSDVQEASDSGWCNSWWTTSCSSVSVLISACCVDKVGHRASECPNKWKPTAFSRGKRSFGTYALVCAVFDSQCYGATVEEIEQDQHEDSIEDFVAFSIKGLGGIRHS